MSNSESNRQSQPHINNARIVDQIPESMNCSNEDDDATNEINEDADEEIEDGNNSSVQFNPFSDSSHGGSSTDEERTKNDADGIGDIDDLVKGIETSFDNTTLDEALKGFNFHYEKEVNESSEDSDRFSDDNGSTSHDENNNKPIPIGGNAAMRAQVSLLRLLEESSVPIGLFDKIMDWASEAKSSGYDFPTTPQRRETIIKNFSIRYQMHEMHAKQTSFPMEGGGIGTITHFDFEAMVHSLLSDPRIAASLLINWKNPNEGVSHGSSTIGDIHTGKWFLATHRSACALNKMTYFVP